MTGDPAISTFLVSSRTPQRTATVLSERLSRTGAHVADVVSARSSVTTVSGLAAADLTGLSRLELAFALLLALACSGLALLLGAGQRRRALVLLSALGATAGQRRRFLSAEANALLLGGLAAGTAITAVISFLLVKVLTGIFDPPPTAPSIPVSYLLALLVSVGGATALAVAGLGRLGSRAGPAELREL
jgi:putative ABC transport system permease protein